MQIILILIGILFTVFVAIHPFDIKKININMATGAIFALVTLLLLQIINFETIKIGILGSGSLKPWEIIVIFFTVAYVSISTDITGIFDYLAYKIVHFAKGNGFKLFLFFYLFASVLTVFTSNDIVILTLTPIIFYLGRHAKINVLPLLFVEFFGANTLSMFLYIGNPTNIIVGNALGLGFLEYTKIMWLPTVIAAITNFLILLLVFRKQITRKYTVNHSSHFSVRNWFDAILSSILIVIMLVSLTLSQSINVPIWIITLVFAVIFIIEDIAFGIFYYIKEHKLTHVQIKKGKDVYGIPKKKNEFWIAFKRVPWKILPFIFTFFIFAQALNEFGVVDYIAKMLAQASSNLANGIIVNGFFGLFLANIINNQPMTIFLSNVLINDSFVVSDLAFKGSAYAIIIASNLGANITLIGALAGLMWNNILKTKGLNVSYLDFIKKSLLITPIVFCITLMVLYFVLLNS